MFEKIKEIMFRMTKLNAIFIELNLTESKRKRFMNNLKKWFKQKNQY